MFCIGAALPLMTILLGSLTNLFGGFVSPGTPSLTPPATAAEFDSQVSTPLFALG